jgi:hypothetical protein
LKLDASQTILYENKNLIKRRAAILPLWIKVAAAAAIFLLAYILLVPNPGMRSEIKIQVAQSKNHDAENSSIPKDKVELANIKVDKTVIDVNRKGPNAKASSKKKLIQAVDQQEKNIGSKPELRDSEPLPLFLKPKRITFAQNADLELAVMTIAEPRHSFEDLQLSELLKGQLDSMRKSEDRDFLSSDHLGLTGLHLIARLSGKRLTARKGNDGFVRSVSYNSRLLAFSIPVNR